MDNECYNHPSKKKNTTLIVGLLIVGIFILGIVALFVTFSIEEKQDKPWKSGQVQILGKDIQLPCDVDTFEYVLNTKIIDNEYGSYIKDVKIRLDYNSVLIFDVYVENNMVTGIMLETYESDEDETFKKDPYSEMVTETERDTALNIIFPGNVTIESSIDEIKELYGTKPFNSSYTYWKEEIGSKLPYEVLEQHKYQNSDWSIEIHTMDGEITRIDYIYLNY